MYLSALLKGRALDVYSMMPTEYANDYDQLKDALPAVRRWIQEAIQISQAGVRGDAHTVLNAARQLPAPLDRARES